MAELKIEVEHRYCEYGATLAEKLDADACFIRVCDGDKIVAEASLESLVKKFLVVSSEYAQAMTLLGLLKSKGEGRIVVANDIPEERNR